MGIKYCLGQHGVGLQHFWVAFDEAAQIDYNNHYWTSTRTSYQGMNTG